MRWTAASVLTLMAAGCGSGPRVAGPSAVEPATKVVAVMVGDGVLLKVENLHGARQVEGTLEWVPASLWYQSFQQGRWWFSAAEWEWVMVPNEGGTRWGVWRAEPASGDGVLGLIRLEGMPSVTGLRVWVDGVPVEAEAATRPDDRLDVAGQLGPAAGTLGASRGAPDHRWFLPALLPPG